MKSIKDNFLTYFKNNKLGMINLFILTLLVVYWFVIFYRGVFLITVSDFPNHLSAPFDGQGYSLASILIYILYGGNKHSNLGPYLLIVILVFNSFLSIFTLNFLLSYIFPDVDKQKIFLASLLTNIIGTILIPKYGMSFYIGAYSGNVYHNETLLFSRTFANLALAYIMKMFFDDDLSLKTYLSFTVTILISTLFKPNFVFALIPFLGIYMLVNIFNEIFFKKGNEEKKLIIKYLKIASAFIPAVAICMLQYLLIYVFNNVQQVKDDSRIAILIPGIRESARIAIRYARGCLLPIFVYFFMGKYVKNYKKVNFIYLLAATTFLQNIFLIETGIRRWHGNFSWGQCTIYHALFGVAITSLFYLIDKVDGHARTKLISAVMLSAHLIFGIIYMVLILIRYTYFF